MNRLTEWKRFKINLRWVIATILIGWALKLISEDCTDETVLWFGVFSQLARAEHDRVNPVREPV